MEDQYELNIKNIVIIVSIVFIIIAGIATFFFVKHNNQVQQEFNQAQTELKYTYGLQNNAFCMYNNSDVDYGRIYRPYSAIVSSPNGEKNLQNDLYIYNDETGKVVTLQDIKDYLSSETNSDGSEKTYLNSDDVKVNNYVKWSLSTDYWDSNRTAPFVAYCENYEKNMPNKGSFYDLTLAQLQELHKAYKDPSYTPNVEIMQETSSTVS